MAKTLEEQVNALEEELSKMDMGAADDHVLVTLYKLKKTVDAQYDGLKTKLLKDLPEGYSNIFPDLGFQLTVRPGKETPVYDMGKLRAFLGQDLWNVISKVSQSDVVDKVGRVEADKFFSLSRIATNVGSTIVDIRPITKTNQ